MDQKRKCPECGSEKYLFRDRNKIAEEGKPEVTVTTYRCKERERVARKCPIAKNRKKLWLKKREE